MPIWLRNFTFNKIQDYFDKKAEAANAASNVTSAQIPKISRPNIKPDYTTKASTK